MGPERARRMWLVGERIHALTYFAQEALDTWAAAGLRGFWRGYFATRAAPLGRVPPEVVTATFFGFEAGMVARAIPSVWDLAAPEAALAARLAGMDAALRSVVGEPLLAAAGDDVVAALRDAVDACPRAGRALFAANAALPWPDEPHLAIWHGLTCLREHRGDGHNAALVAEGLDGCQANVLAGAVGGSGRDVIQPTRGWSDEQWADALQSLAGRGLVTADGAATEAGRALKDRVEAVTDELALVPWAALGPERTALVEERLLPWARAIQDAGVIRQPNPMGLPPLPPR